jgi:hypothetical protein
MKKKLTHKDLPSDLSKLASDIYKSVGVNLQTKPKSKLKSFNSLLSPFLDAYNQVFKNKKRKFIWKGPDFSNDFMKKTCKSLKVLLSFNGEKEQIENHGHTFIESLFTGAIQIGIEQGIKIEREDSLNFAKNISDEIEKFQQELTKEKKTEVLLKKIEALKSTLSNYQESKNV